MKQSERMLQEIIMSNPHHVQSGGRHRRWIMIGSTSRTERKVKGVEAKLTAFCLAPRMSTARETHMRCGCPSHLLSSRDTCYLCPSKCLCHLLTLVIGSIITTSIDVSLCRSFSRSLSSCRRTELNCGNKENERKRALVLFIHFSSLSLSFSSNVCVCVCWTEEKRKRWWAEKRKPRKEREPLMVLVVVARRKWQGGVAFLGIRPVVELVMAMIMIIS